MFLTKIYFLNGVKSLLVFFVLFLTYPAQSQDREIDKAEKKAEKLELQEKKAFEKSKEKAIKEHYNRQSETTKAQMKISKKNADKFNDEKKDGFFKHLLRKKKHKKLKKKRKRKIKRYKT